MTMDINPKSRLIRSDSKPDTHTMVIPPTQMTDARIPRDVPASSKNKVPVNASIEGKIPEQPKPLIATAAAETAPSYRLSLSVFLSAA